MSQTSRVLSQPVNIGDVMAGNRRRTKVSNNTMETILPLRVTLHRLVVLELSFKIYWAKLTAAW